MAKKKVDPLREIINLNADYMELSNMYDLLDDVQIHANYNSVIMIDKKGKEIKVCEVLDEIMEAYLEDMTINSKKASNYLKQLDKPQPKITRPAIDSHTTQVQFLYNKSGNDLFAYFPNEAHNGQLNTAYSHVGQHSACSIEYVNECEQATPDQYKDLKSELKSIGYNLEILTK